MASGTRPGDQVAYALLADGTAIQIRPARQEDYDAVRDMHASMSADNLYLRFFSASKFAPEEEARRICREPAPDHAALLALLDGEVVGCGSFERGDEHSRSAEIAMAVADDMHERGVGMLLLEHMISLARSRGIRVFTAQTLAEQARAAGVRRRGASGAPRPGRLRVRPQVPAPGRRSRRPPRRLPGRGSRTRAVGRRGQPVARAGPGLGRGHRPPPASGSAGTAVLRNIVTGGFGGPVYVVSPGLADLDGTPCLPSVAALPDQVDLAVIAVREMRCRQSPESAGGGSPGPRGGHLRAGRCGPGGAAGHLPSPRHAADRTGLVRGGQHRHFPRRHHRGPASPARDRGPGAAVQ